MYSAGIVSHLICGLETMYLNDSLPKRLDAFQMRGLRYILHLESCEEIKITLQRAKGIKNGDKLQGEVIEFTKKRDKCRICCKPGKTITDSGAFYMVKVEE